MNFIITVGKNKKTTYPGDAPGKEFDKIQRGFICPVYILKYDEYNSFLPAQFLEYTGEEPGPVVNVDVILPDVRSDLPGDIIQGRQRTRGKQCITSPLVYFTIVFFPPAKS